jgi:hypothetical protein
MGWRGFGFVHHSRTLFCHAVPNPNITIRNFSIAVRERRWFVAWAHAREGRCWVGCTSGANGANCPFWVLFVGFEVKNLAAKGGTRSQERLTAGAYPPCRGKNRPVNASSITSQNRPSSFSPPPAAPTAPPLSPPSSGSSFSSFRRDTHTPTRVISGEAEGCA